MSVATPTSKFNRKSMLVLFGLSASSMVFAGQGGGNELLQNGNFAAGMKGWKVEETESKGKFEVVAEGPKKSKALKIVVVQPGKDTWRLQAYQGNLAIKKGQMYRLSYSVKSDRAATITVNCMQNHEPWEHHGAAHEVKLTKNWTEGALVFAGPWDEKNARVTFTNLSTVKGQTYWITNVSLKAVASAAKKNSGGSK